MRVAVVNLTSGGFSGGYRKYLDRLVPLLREDPRVSALEVYGPGSSRHQVSQLSPDVVFIPTARWSNFGPPPVVAMVRNMEPLTVPFGGNPPIESLKNLTRAQVARRACRRGDRIIAVSSHVRDFLVDRWGIDGSKIGVVEHGVNPPIPRADASRPPALTGDLGRGFVFTAGSVRPARGLEDVIRAMRPLAERGLSLPLVVAGSSPRGAGAYEHRMRRLAADCGVEQHVAWVGQLSDAEMAWCYHHCSCFVTTSRAEACPNVLLEAMAHGCVCIAVRQPPMTHMLRDAGLYYTLGQPSDLAQQLAAAVVADAAARHRLRQSTLARAARWDWHRAAAETVAQLELVALRRRGEAPPASYTAPDARRESWGPGAAGLPADSSPAKEGDDPRG
jgi:glycosyltransferase involved in cell wall biosynthesis